MRKTAFQLGDVLVDPALNQIRREGQIIHIKPMTMDLLVYLVDKAPSVVSNEQMLDDLWTDRVVEGSVIHRRINQIRQALGDDARHPLYIETVPKRGYRVVARIKPIEEKSSLTPTPPQEMSESGNLFNWQEKRRLLASLVLFAATLIAWLVYTTLVSMNGGLAMSDGLPRIAVLPFQDFSTTGSNTNLAAGFHEDIISKLANIDGLRVTSRTSVQRFANSGMRSIPEIARELSVTHIIEGSLQKSGNSVRVTVQLIDANSEDHIWAETYDRDATDIFAIQSDVARRVAFELERELTPDALLRLDYTPTENLAAYELVINARKLIDIGTVDSLARAVDTMAAAIMPDPMLAEAHSGFSRALFLQTFLGVPWREVRDRALQASEQALGLDPGSANIHPTMPI